MDISHSFRFQWNDHVPHLSQIFSELRFDETYCETTLITDDGYVLKAHAAILMSTSRYFERILAGISSDQHPIVVLKGVNFPELSCILDYIYQGSIQVHQHLMEQVLDTADILEVKGLSNMKNNLSVRKLIAPSLSRSSSMSSSPSKSPIPPSPSSPSEIYASSSAAALKPDMEEHTEERASSPKQKHSSAPDVRLVDSGEYLPASSRKPVATSIAPVPTASASSTSEHLDQTLGIDLSLSRVSNEDSERNCSKTVYEDSFFRKRKHLGEECVPHRKKRLFNRAVSHMKSFPSVGREEEKPKSNAQLTFENLTAILSRDKGESKVVPDAAPISSLVPKSKSTNLAHETAADTYLDSHVEVLCSDGALTISVTADNSHPQSAVKNLSGAGAQVSLSLKKAKRRSWSGRGSSALPIKKESEERKGTGSLSLRRPDSRLLRRVKGLSAASHSEVYQTENLSVQCDPPFPATDDGDEAKLKKSYNSNLSNDGKLGKVTGSEEEDEEEDEDREEGDRRRMRGKGARRLSCISPLTLFTLPPAKEKEKQTRTSLTLEEKMKVIQAFLDGKSQRQIARAHGIGKTQVNGIVRRRDEILSLYRESVVRGEKLLTMKRQRRSEYASLNDHMIKWYRHMTVVSGVKVTTGMLRAKALQIAPQLGYRDFKASNGWLGTFKSNHNLKLSRVRKSNTNNDSFSSENYDEDDVEGGGGTGKEGEELFEDEVEEGGGVGGGAGTDHPLNVGVAAPATSVVVSSATEGAGLLGPPHSMGLHHLGAMRTDPEGAMDLGGISAPGQPPPVGNISLGNSLLSSSGALPKPPPPPQMGNVSLGPNLAAYNLTRDPHPHHLSDLHHHSSASSVNTATAPPHPPSLAHASLAAAAAAAAVKPPPEGPLSYKTEESISYGGGYDTQGGGGRMNEGGGASSRGAAAAAAAAASSAPEYNYAHYGFPGTYYGYHFLGQY